MSLESLKENIKYEKEIVEELLIFNSQLEQARFTGNKKDEKIINQTINALLNLLNLTNNSIPKLIEGEIKKRPAKIKKVLKLRKTEGKKLSKTSLVRVSYVHPAGKKYVTIKKEDKNKFLKELSLSLDSINKLKKDSENKEIAVRLFKKPSFYAKFSNKFFWKISNKLVNKGYFKDINMDMRKANMALLLNTYISMALMSAVIGLILGIVVFIVLVFFAEKISNILLYSLIILGIPLVVLGGFYFYPAMEKTGIKKKINQELPFVTIHMSAIAGSGIEPSQIFKIIALSEEYPYTRKEFRKVVNQVNVYGYDLVNALKNAARSTSSSKISELFNGLATTISSGGKLTDFLDKRAESLLFDYRLERERFTKTAETFMDIYISVVIAAPMIMMLMLVLISISGINIGLSINSLGFIIILIVALINIIFLVIMHIKQPSY